MIKHDGHLRTRGKCRKHEPHASISTFLSCSQMPVVFYHTCFNTRVRLLCFFSSNQSARRSYLSDYLFGNCLFYHALSVFLNLFCCSRYKLVVAVLFAQMYNRTWYVLECVKVLFWIFVFVYLLKAFTICIARSFSSSETIFNKETKLSERKFTHLCFMYNLLC